MPYSTLLPFYTGKLLATEASYHVIKSTTMSCMHGVKIVKCISNVRFAHICKPPLQMKKKKITDIIILILVQDIFTFSNVQYSSGVYA